MNVKEAIYGRRAVRKFTPELVDEQTTPPSAVNMQPWSFTVITDQALLDRILQSAKRYMLALPSIGSWPQRLREHLQDPDFDIFYRAPALIVISAVTQGEWIVEDCALAAENLMLAAHASGLGSCWIGFAQRWLNTPEGRQATQLQAGHIAIAPIIIGHPKEATAPVPRYEAKIRWLA